MQVDARDNGFILCGLGLHGCRSPLVAGCDLIATLREEVGFRLAVDEEALAVIHNAFLSLALLVHRGLVVVPILLDANASNPRRHLQLPSSNNFSIATRL